MRPPLLQYWIWCRSTRRDSQPGNRHLPRSRSRAALRSAAFGRRRLRPRSSILPPAPWSIQDSAAEQPSMCAVLMLIAAPSSTWHRPGSAGSPGGTGADGGVSAGAAARRRWRRCRRGRRPDTPPRHRPRPPSRPGTTPPPLPAHRPGPTMLPPPALPPAGAFPRKRRPAALPFDRRQRVAPSAAPPRPAAAAGTIRLATRPRRTATPAAAGPGYWRHQPGEHCRCARANRSSWFPVIGPAISARPASVAAVAIRVSARTLA